MLPLHKHLQLDAKFEEQRKFRDLHEIYPHNIVDKEEVVVSNSDLFHPMIFVRYETFFEHFDENLTWTELS